jgi:hypothetical protein
MLTGDLDLASEVRGRLRTHPWFTQWPPGEEPSDEEVTGVNSFWLRIRGHVPRLLDAFVGFLVESIDSQEHAPAARVATAKADVVEWADALKAKWCARRLICDEPIGRD